jgi:AbrB family looped-hinge helix DNA binding protein
LFWQQSLPIGNGKMAFMIATVELDKLGRLVVPKKVRDAVGLRTGFPLRMEVRGNEVILRPQTNPRGLYKEDGLWVYDSGTPMTTDDVNQWIADDRDRRMRHIGGESLEP